VAEYEKSLADNLAGLVDDTGENVNPNWQPDRVNHNRISAALVVEYERTRIVLGADMDTAAWEAVLGEIDQGTEYNLPLACHLIKVSHHGSMTGHCEGLYERRFARRRRKPIAVVTPFNRHRHPLPSREGVDHLLSHTSLVLATNRAEAHHACGRLLPDHVEFPAGAGEASIPVTWASALTSNPALRGAFIPSESETAEVASPPAAVPLDWRHDLIANPRLARLLHPEIRRFLRTEEVPGNTAAETECRVSLYFNDKGRELKSRRYVGSRAGQLT
jgi:hypothetical protein